ncbi:MAG: DUF342 domain-containing protein [Chitinivibrionales bacterium]|nr:DUF342 domain-containing protein [Chitinivibrionales bacterium]
MAEQATALSNILKTEVRADGLYMTVTREDRERIDTDKLKIALEKAQVMNVNLPKIFDVIKRARGVAERIGQPFRYYDNRKDKYMMFDAKPERATVTLSSEANALGLKITAEDVLWKAGQMRIAFGVDESRIEWAINDGSFDEPVEFAFCEKPEHGLDARIEMLVNIDEKAKPKLLPDGSVDFRNIELFKQVNTDDLIARRYPPTKGKDGIDVFGNPMPANEGRDLALPQGKNTVVDNTNQRLMAACSGFMYRDGQLVCVGEVLIIPKDVNFETGNIKYKGAVVIKGNIKAGFEVDAGQNVIIEGLVDGADITSRNGSITVKKAIFGHDDCTLYAKKNIECELAQNLCMEAEGKITIKKFCLQCKVTTAEFEAAAFIGGLLAATKKIKLLEAGNAKSVKTSIAIVDTRSQNFKEKLEELSKIEKKLKQKLEPLERRIRTIITMMKHQDTQIRGKTKDEIKKVTLEHSTLKKKVNYVEQKRSEIIKSSKAPPDTSGEIVVSGPIHPGVAIKLYHQDYQVRTKQSHKRYCIKDNILHSGSDTEETAGEADGSHDEGSQNIKKSDGPPVGEDADAAQNQ